ncbi:agamous-like MADS-box protein AGL80 [Canna indica]|uniref:Agamous-like MADS-box protein AGL80 n=1 Tax=Canna indica TaxID=4628 RepID=A0AAQ3K1Q6_9LILI|nr:agamous-like MADS-box protein AGL80 [Canna indica]
MTTEGLSHTSLQVATTMVKSKVELAWISDDATRRATMKKRRKELMKELWKLSVSCDVEACAVVYEPDEQVPEVWPSANVARGLLVRFMELPEDERRRKLTDQEVFLKQRLAKLVEQLKQKEFENRQLELRIMMRNGLMGYGIDELSIEDSAALTWLIDIKLKEICKKREELVAERLATAVIQPPSQMYDPPSVDGIPMGVLPPPPPRVAVDLSHEDAMLSHLLSVTEEVPAAEDCDPLGEFPSVDGTDLMGTLPPPPVPAIDVEDDLVFP